MLYDPLNQNSSDEDGNKDEILNTLNLPTKVWLWWLKDSFHNISFQDFSLGTK